MWIVILVVIINLTGNKESQCLLLAARRKGERKNRKRGEQKENGRRE